ncbi:hypothetical protein J5N97_008178 [Dioscorea zingiberensis]|uniref:Uncharacterized protein n=1 Tax=Dioscorea zingiberensis TaxID=325984 RepID=A0A9D5HWP7_9LILI|nr:hypothetical protein J5N97_008178 [Dioscorea zingiberensis]
MVYIKPLESSGNGGLAASNTRAGAIDNVGSVMAEGDTTIDNRNKGDKAIPIDKGQRITTDGSELVAKLGGERGVLEPGPDMGGIVELIVAITSYPTFHDNFVKSEFGDLDVAGVHEDLGRAIGLVACHLEA